MKGVAWLDVARRHMEDLQGGRAGAHLRCGPGVVVDILSWQLAIYSPDVVGALVG